MRSVLIILISIAVSTNLFSQSTERIVLEPVGRYIYQSYNKKEPGTDHLLNATGLSDGRILVAANPKMAIFDFNDLSIAGSQEYKIRSERTGARDVVVYKNEYFYGNYHQSEAKANTLGYSVNQITSTSINTITSISEPDVFFEKMKIYDDYLYVAAHDKGFRIYSLSNPEKPSLVCTLSEGFTDVIDIAKSGDTLYVADGGGGLKIVDISDFNAPKILAGENTSTALATSHAIEVRNGNVYVAAGGAGILVYTNGDLINRKQYEIGGCAEQLCWLGDYLAVSNFSGVQVFVVDDDKNLVKVGSENTSRFGNKASIRTSFGVGTAGDSLLLVSTWTTVDCFKLVPETNSTVTDITCSAQRIRFPYNGGSSDEYITNNGGAPLILSKIQLSASDFLCDLTPQTIAVGDTVKFTITYTPGSESDKVETLLITSNDPDEALLPIQLLGNTSTLDPGEEMTDFTLKSFFKNRESGEYEEGTFTVSENRGKVMWFGIFGTWCPACPSAEADMQNTIIKAFQGNPNVETYVINEVNEERDAIDWVKTWASHWYQRVPMLYDETGEVGSKIFKQLNVGNMPFGRGMIINQEGKVEKAFFGHQPQMVIETIYKLLEDEALTSGMDYKQNAEESLTIFPNPVSDHCTISFDKNYTEVKIELFSLAGQKLLSQYFANTQSAQLNLGEMDEGIYVVKINMDNKSRVQKIIKY